MRTRHSYDRRIVLVGVSLLILGIVLAACARPTPTAQPGPVPAERTATPAEVTPGAQPSPTPTASPPAATATPVPLPPTVVDVRPGPGEEVPPDTPIEVVFSAPVDPASVRSALVVQPEVAGDVEVSGPVARFRPKKPFRRGQWVTVHVGAGVKGVNGLALLRPVSYRFATQGALEVARHNPRQGEKAVPITTTVQLAFNRPLVPVDTTNQPTEPPSWLTLTPAVTGTVRWVGSSLLEFTPDPAFRAATTYTVTVNTPLEALDGAPLTEPVTFTFRTATPRVVRIAGTYAGARVQKGAIFWPNKPFTVTFNMPMDPDSVAAHLRLLEDETDQAVAVDLAWPSPSVVRLTPKEPLDLDTVYRVVVDAEAVAADGVTPLVKPAFLTLRTVPPVAVRGSDPLDGEEGVRPGGNGVSVRFVGLVDEESLAGNIAVVPEPTDVFTYFNRYDNRLWIGFEMAAQTRYTVTLGSDIADVFGNTLGEPVQIRFTTGDYPPSASLNLPWGAAMFDANQPVTVTLTGRNVLAGTVTLYRPSAAQVATLAATDPWALDRLGTSSLGDVVRTWNLPFPGTPNVWHQVSAVLADESNESVSAGVYVVDTRVTRAKGKALTARRLVVISPYNVVLKADLENVLVWVTDLRTGQPVADVPLRIISAKDTKDATTDTNGMAQVKFARSDAWTPVAVVTHPDNPDGLVVSTWRDGISSWDFHLPSGYEAPGRLVATFQTERPVYRPGQTVHWKVVVRVDNDGTYELPPDTSPRLTIRDANGDIVLQRDLELNEMGTASGDLPLAEGAALGFYNVDIDNVVLLDYPTLLVAAYRKPEFEISVSANPPEVITGETVRVTAQARYFFGGPVANARVEYVVRDEPFVFDWQCPQAPCPNYSFDEVDWWRWEPFQPVGEPLAKGSGRTDAEGRFTLTLPAELKEEQGSRRWTVEITVFDVSGQVISGRTSVVVHRAAVYPGVASERYVVHVGEEATANLILVDTQGQIVPGAEVTFVALREKWRNVRKKGSDGVFRWVSEVEETPVYTETVQLNDQGRGTVSFTPDEGGSYRLRVTATDDQGRTNKASTFLWVSSSTYVSWRKENNDRLFLVADKNTYQVGDTARVIVPSPFAGPVEALVSLERGTIRKAWRTTLKTNSQIIEVPITSDMAPNVFLSVVLVRGYVKGEPQPGFKVGYVELAVDTTFDLLNVTITPEHERYRPRDTARFTIDVTDYKNNPVDAEVAAALVDKAVLTLFERPSPLAQVFYRKRGLAVATAASMVKNVNRMLQQEQVGGKGGGGGGGGPEAPTVREEFLDVAYWKPDLRTGPQGRVVIEAQLPDNLTTWTLLTWAVDAQTRVGQAEQDIVVTQDFLLRPVLPRFFTVGDEARVGVVAHNLSDTSLRAQVSMTLTGATLVDEPTQEVVLAPGQSQKLTWTVTDVEGAPGDAGPTFTATWTGTTDVEGVDDAVRITLPVRYPAPPEVTATAGMVAQDESRLEVVTLPPDRVPKQGDLTLDVDASLAAGMLDSLTYLRHFRWECSEQTISRFLPNVVTWRALKQLGVSNPDLEKALPDLVATAVQRLTQQQNSDGGWGWWSLDKSNPFLTAYGLWALTEAERAGFSVDAEVPERASRFLFRYLRKYTPGENRWENNRAAMVTFALADYRTFHDKSAVSVFSNAVALFESREYLDNYGQALVGLTFGIFADTAAKEKTAQAARQYLQMILSGLERGAVTDPTGTHWEERDVDWWNMNNDVRTTSIVLLLMARYDPENPLAPNAVRWLMSARKGDRWTHTQDTAWSVVALTDWMRQTGELQPDYDYTAWLNGVVWLSGTMTPTDVGTTHTATVPITDLNADQPNWVQIERGQGTGQHGEGALYYRLLLTTFRPLENLQPESRGITVERWYTRADDDTVITRARVGDLITVHLRIVAARSLQYLMLEDPLPAGVEPVDVRLLTSTREAEGPRTERVEEKAKPRWWYWWYWQPTHSELRDDRGAFFQSYMSPGTYEITYQVRASIPGRFIVGPATASQMYAPEVFGRNAATVFVVEE